jgi:bromodomain-containing protein 8
VNAHKFAAIFRKAVNEKDAPGYKKIVKEPMDLGLIRDRVQSGQIQSFDEVRHFALLLSLLLVLLYRHCWCRR